MAKARHRTRHQFVGNAHEQSKAIDDGTPCPAYQERCTRCGLVVGHVQTPKERRRYCKVQKTQKAP